MISSNITNKIVSHKYVGLYIIISYIPNYQTDFAVLVGDVGRVAVTDYFKLKFFSHLFYICVGLCNVYLKNIAH